MQLIKKISYAIANFFLRFRFFRKAITILNWEKTAYVEAMICKEISPQGKVLAGTFKGMIYPELKSDGSPLLAKIIGSYEDELNEVFKKVVSTGYKTVIDVGCAEGYYAVGLAMRLPDARVFAFDTDKAALGRCKKMAEANGVANRVEFGGFCDANMLRDFAYIHPSLIISDCEGYEKELFVPGNLAELKNTDILVELHDYTVPEIGDYITGLFKESHNMQFVQSLAKHIRNYPLLRNIDKKNYRDSILIERDDLMTWVFLEAKTGNNRFTVKEGILKK